MNILSLGAGVQSTALLLASIDGIIPKTDYAIFSDTGWEPKNVYDHLDKLEKEIAEPAGIPIFRVSAGDIRDEIIEKKPFIRMPLHLKNTSGSKSMAVRQCTNIYKVRPVCEKIRELLGATRNADGFVGRTKWHQQVDLQIGISVDEIERAKPSKVKYVNHTFPLLDLGWSRQDCLDYLDSKGWKSVSKSSCIGCPFKSNKQWIDLKNNDEDSWLDAVRIDNMLRDMKHNKPTIEGLFLHRSCKPLEEAVVLNDESSSQYDLFSCSPFSCTGDEMLNGIDLVNLNYKG